VILHPAMPAAETEPGPLERLTTRVRTADGRLGTAEVAPDHRFFVTLDDGQSFVVDLGEVTVLDDSVPSG
jgi:hypothetical protein